MRPHHELDARPQPSRKVVPLRLVNRASEAPPSPGPPGRSEQVHTLAKAIGGGLMLAVLAVALGYAVIAWIDMALQP